jgi:hypothetical protein
MGLTIITLFDMWVYENSDKIVSVDTMHSKFSGKLNDYGHLIVPAHVIKKLKEVLNMTTLHKNCELVVEVKAVMVPPNEWIKIN